VPDRMIRIAEPSYCPAIPGTFAVISIARAVDAAIMLLRPIIIQPLRTLTSDPFEKSAMVALPRYFDRFANTSLAIGKAENAFGQPA
jgi:hypothetical protein